MPIFDKFTDFLQNKHNNSSKYFILKKHSNSLLCMLIYPINTLIGLLDCRKLAYLINANQVGIALRFFFVVIFIE